MRPSLHEVFTAKHLSSQGDAVGRLGDGRVVFVVGAAPEERVSVRLVKSNKRYARAEVVEVLQPGKTRVEPRCAYFGQCGGCSLQHIDANAQVESKQNALEQALERMGGISLGDIEIDPAWTGDSYAYRSRARFGTTREGQLGFREKKSDRVVPVSNCPILTPPLQGFLESGPALASEQEVSAFSAGAAVLSTLEELEELETEDGFGPRILAPQVFAQSNEEGNQALLRYVETLLEGCQDKAAALELYAGSGNLTRVLAKHYRLVRACESEAKAQRLASRILPAHASCEKGDAESFVRSVAGESARANMILVDPPRAGLSEEVVSGLGSLLGDLIYVSCDAGTFSRDVKRLRTCGLNLVRMRLFDFYPQTPEMEMCGFFQRASGS